MHLTSFKIKKIKYTADVMKTNFTKTFKSTNGKTKMKEHA